MSVTKMKYIYGLINISTIEKVVVLSIDDALSYNYYTTRTIALEDIEELGLDSEQWADKGVSKMHKLYLKDMK